MVRTTLGPCTVLVAYSDDTLQIERTSDLTLLQSAPLAPLQIVASLGPGAAKFLTGSDGSFDGSSPIWIAAALAWDVLLVLAVLGGVRAKIPTREWLFPACIGCSAPSRR